MIRVAIVKQDRGQLLIITALLLAILFVALALILNSGIYTENLSTRSAGGSMEPLSEDQVSQDRLIESMALANYHNETANYSKRLTVVEANVSTWGQQQSERHAKSGHVLTTDVAVTTEGVRVTQKNESAFLPAEDGLMDEHEEDGETYRLDPLGLGDRMNWLVAPNVSTRAFEMTVQRNSLTKDQQNLLDDLEDLGDTILTGSNEFWVQIEGNNTTKRVYLVNDTSNGTVSAVVTEIDGTNETLVGSCRVNGGGDEATVRISAAEIESNGKTEACPELSTGEGPHDIYYVGGDEVKGTYQLIADKPEDVFRDDVEQLYITYLEQLKTELDNDGLLDTLLGGSLFGGILDDLVDNPDSFVTQDAYDDSPNGEPYTTTAVYSVSVELTYKDDRMTHTRNVTLAPAEK